MSFWCISDWAEASGLNLHVVRQAKDVASAHTNSDYRWKVSQEVKHFWMGPLKTSWGNRMDLMIMTADYVCFLCWKRIWNQLNLISLTLYSTPALLVVSSMLYFANRIQDTSFSLLYFLMLVFFFCLSHFYKIGKKKVKNIPCVLEK